MKKTFRDISFCMASKMLMTSCYSQMRYFTMAISILILIGCKGEEPTSLQIEGVITDKDSGNAIEGISVRLVNNAYFGGSIIYVDTFSDENGYYRLEYTFRGDRGRGGYCIPSSVYVRVSKEGYSGNSEIICTNELQTINFDLECFHVFAPCDE